MFHEILAPYALGLEHEKVEPYGSGLINHTWKIQGADQTYILQQINTNVFKNPENIDHNVNAIRDYLQQKDPDYLFAAPLVNTNGDSLIVINDKYYRLFTFIKDSYSIDFVVQKEQAYEAAKQFGKFSRLLNDFDPSQLKYSLLDFHNLPLRIAQFYTALEHADGSLLKAAENEIGLLKSYLFIGDRYTTSIEQNKLKLRVTHHDTKISNVLLSHLTGEGICVIDLDTVMPGYYISDVGDMMRTYLSEATEEEKDLEKVKVKPEIFYSIYKGYMEEMGSIMTPDEKDLFIYSGEFMIYMQALRFLTDFLNGNVYYPIEYPEHNLRRAQNQIALLNSYISYEEESERIISELNY